MSVSALVLTYNEEVNLPGCLASLEWCDDVVVFDSFSTDRTVEFAEAAGVRVFQRKFDDYGSQREAARTSVPYKHSWVLSVDADERPDEELVREVTGIAARNDAGPAAYRFRRKDYFMGTWIRHASLYPSWFVRLYRPERIRYDARAVHEYPVVEGPTGELKGHLIHHSFGKGMGDWLAKHERYAALEARENVASLRDGRIDWAGIVSGCDPVRRRRAIKSLSFRLPFRPELRFIYMYLVRAGFIDGRPGLTYCRLLSMYERRIVIEMKELRRWREERPG